MTVCLFVCLTLHLLQRVREERRHISPCSHPSGKLISLQSCRSWPQFFCKSFTKTKHTYYWNINETILQLRSVETLIQKCQLSKQSFIQFWSDSQLSLPLPTHTHMPDHTIPPFPLQQGIKFRLPLLEASKKHERSNHLMKRHHRVNHVMTRDNINGVPDNLQARLGEIDC